MKRKTGRVGLGIRSIMLIAFALVATVSICAGGVEEQQGSVSLTVPRVQGWVTTDAMLPLVQDRLEAQDIELETVPGANSALKEQQVLDARQGTGEFDVYLVWEALLPMFDGDVEPLNEYLEAAGVDPQEFIGQFYPSIADVAMVDGELRWIPIHVNTQIGYARADLFDDPDNQARFQEEYSYALPQPDSSGHISFGSWQEIADVAQFMTMDDNSDGHPEIWGLIQAGKWGQGNTIFEDQMLRNGLSYTDEDGYSMWGERHPGNQDVIREIAEFTYNTTNTWHVSSPGILSMQMTEVNSLFMEGKAAMTFTWNVDFWSKLKEGSDFADTYGQPYTWGFEFLNEGTDNKGFISIYCYGLSSQSENKDAVVQFLLQMADEGLRREAHSTAALPCPNGMVDVSQWAVEQELVPAGYPAAIDSVGLMWPTSPGWPETELLRDVTREHREKLLAGDITPDEFVTLTAQNVENVMREAGYIE